MLTILRLTLFAAVPWATGVEPSVSAETREPGVAGQLAAHDSLSFGVCGVPKAMGEYPGQTLRESSSTRRL